MTPVLLDTSCIVGLLDRSEQYHERCVEAIQSLDAPLITCEAVIAEACYLMGKVKGGPEAVLQNVEAGQFLIPYRASDNAGRIRRLMRRYADVPMDFADACLVDMASHFLTGRILTLDRDFYIYRWGRNRPFELLIDLR
jgi:predicted nucleic acid-binding protein